MLGRWEEGAVGASSTDSSGFLRSKGPAFGSESQLSKHLSHVNLPLVRIQNKCRLTLHSKLGTFHPASRHLLCLCCISTMLQGLWCFHPHSHWLSLSTCSSLSYLEVQQRQQHMKSPLYLPSLSNSFLNSLLHKIPDHA